MSEEFINITPENLKEEHLSCIIRKNAHIGVDAKREWLAQRLQEGHVFRKLNVKDVVFIEYAPLETAWVPIIGDNYMYMYCLWVSPAYKGKGYGKALLDDCIQDAKAKGKSGVCMLGAKKQKAWLSDQSFAKKHGFEVVDQTENGYDVLALSFDGTTPAFAPNAKKMEIDDDCLTIYYGAQCPFVLVHLQKIKSYCEEQEIQAQFIPVDSLLKAKNMPCVYNNWAVFYKGKFVTLNLVDKAYLAKLLKVEG